MSALPETNVHADAVITPLMTDHYLEHQYGHLSPSELAEQDIADQHKSRVAQLQIAALYLIIHSSEEVSDWIRSYHIFTNQVSDETTYN